MRNDDLKGPKRPQEIVEAQTMEQRLDYVPLFGELDDMLTLQRQHYDQLCHYVCQLWYDRLIEPQKIIQDVDIDETII